MPPAGGHCVWFRSAATHWYAWGSVSVDMCQSQRVGVRTELGKSSTCAVQGLVCMTCLDTRGKQPAVLCQPFVA